GKTNKHHTFFEMLGNFSFGDYFKKEAIEFAWELVTDVFKLEQERLYATVYEEDEEAFRIWNEGIGMPAERIFRFGRKDNFWAMGETGPCGPCSEIHYDIDPDYEAGEPRVLIERGSDRFLELWNLVFMQYFQDDQGALHPLPSPSIDTGMGLERTAAALQRKTSNFETDLFRPLIHRICELAQREYQTDSRGDVSVRIIADHVRAVTFLIGDGIMPANEGRGYVLRRLIRRAFRHGNYLGLERPFLYLLVGRVADIMKEAYPELTASIAFISRVCLSEEERFALTLSSGLRYFQQFAEEATKAGRRALSGTELFKLYDTFGFPLDLSRELAQESGLDVDEEGFQAELAEQKERARSAWKGDVELEERKAYERLKKIQTSFRGYETDCLGAARVVAILKDGREADSLKKAEKGHVVLDSTPFYAEAGGQIGDSGEISNARFSGRVVYAFYTVPDVIAHDVLAVSGELRVGDEVEAVVDSARRRAIRNNHTATHLLHACLRRVLGEHVKQAGSLVSAERLRFDFTHFVPLSRQEIEQVEDLVNLKIQENLTVETRLTTLEEGLKEGAMAIFEEKYGEKVRLVEVRGFSKELCGGVHVHATGEIGFFKIIGESSIAAGMRRIEAVTGEEALRHVQDSENLLVEIQAVLGSPRLDILRHLEKMKAQLETAEKENRALRQTLAEVKSRESEAKIRNIKGINVLAQRLEGVTVEELRNLVDSLKQKIGSGVIVLGTASDGKALLVVGVTKDLTHLLKADELIRDIAPLIGGGGGGRPDFAQAGGKKPEKLDMALEKTYALIEKKI
ncbi:MAG: alanine--tRNA ligase, partial [Candidatus Aminicenantes bacterium]|nr:alanine--tRNA ligase [Candidatus Aminicenantes bacterium]